MKTYIRCKSVTETMENLGIKLTKMKDGIAKILLKREEGATVEADELVTMDYVSDDGDLVNNIVHKTGVEHVSGIKTWTDNQDALNVGRWLRLYSTEGGSRWFEVARIPRTNTSRVVLEILGAVNGPDSLCYGKAYFLAYADSKVRGGWIERYATSNTAYVVGDVLAYRNNEDDTCSIFFKLNQFCGVDFNFISGKVQSGTIPTGNIKQRSIHFSPGDSATLPQNATIVGDLTKR